MPMQCVVAAHESKRFRAPETPFYLFSQHHKTCDSIRCRKTVSCVSEIPPTITASIIYGHFCICSTDWVISTKAVVLFGKKCSCVYSSIIVSSIMNRTLFCPFLSTSRDWLSFSIAEALSMFSPLLIISFAHLVLSLCSSSLGFLEVF